MKVLVIGANNSGKGTLVKLLKEKTGLSTIGCSSVLSKNGLDIATGVLLPDEPVNEIMKDYLNQYEHFILDGYPRTLAQNEYMKEFCQPDLIIVLKISEEEVLNRAVGRRICKICSDIYNLNGFKIPKKEGVCDKCGGELLHREDDKEEAVKRRFKEYIEKTYPIVESYKENNLKTVVWEFDVSQQSNDEISNAVAEYINYKMMEEYDADAIGIIE